MEIENFPTDDMSLTWVHLLVMSLVTKPEYSRMSDCDIGTLLVFTNIIKYLIERTLKKQKKIIVEGKRIFISKVI